MTAKSPSSLNTVMTADETLVHYSAPVTKPATNLSKHTGGPPKKVRQTKSSGKVLMTIFLDRNGVVYQHAVPPQITVNAEYYISDLKHLRRYMSIKRPELVEKWILHHNNAHPHMLTCVQQFLTKCSIESMPQHAYSLVLVPCDFCLSPTMNEKFRTATFNRTAEVIPAVQGSLKQIPQNAFVT